MNVDRSRMGPISMTYTNYKGETAVRRIVPISVDFGTTYWHRKPQWLLSAYDLDKEAHREFALSDCDFTTPV